MSTLAQAKKLHDTRVRVSRVEGFLVFMRHVRPIRPSISTKLPPLNG